MGVLQPVLDLVRRIKGSEPTGKTRIELDKAAVLRTIRETSLFAGLPAENVEAMYAHMEVVEAADGQVVIREGTEGDYFYILAQGRASITRRSAEGKRTTVADVAAPHGFGEEALISNRPRNATVTMTGAGVLVRLSKAAFNDYVKKPFLEWLFPSEALARVSQGARWLDTRDAGPFPPEPLAGAVVIPLEQIRERCCELDRAVPYVCYCQNGRLSSTAAFLLRQRGYQASVLRGGLQAMKSRSSP